MMISPSHRKKAILRQEVCLWLLLTAAFVADVITATIIINEVNIDNPGTDINEFVELYNTNLTSSVMLTNYVLVFYDGSSGAAYQVIPLGGHLILSGGYFVVGSSSLKPGLNLSKTEHNIQNGIDGIALYLTLDGDTSYQPGMKVTDRGLVDAIVYDTSEANVTTPLTALAPGQSVVQETWYAYPGDESLSKCGEQRNQPLFWQAFKLTTPTPGRENDCVGPTSPPSTVAAPPEVLKGDVVISEFNADNPMTDNAEFIELYHKNGTMENLTGYVIALYSHDLTAYFVLDLSNYSTNAQGYFVMGRGVPNLDFELPTGVVIQNGQDAIALYKGNPSDYTQRMQVSIVGLIQAVVYENEKSTDVGLAAALGVQTIHFEDENFMAQDESVSLCNLSHFKLTVPTPGKKNNCSYVPPTELPTSTLAPTSSVSPVAPSLIVINELNADNPSTENQEYLELFDGGIGETPLSGYQVVLYDSSGLSYKVWNLTGNMTNEAGYFVIGGTGVSPRPDIVFGGTHVIRNSGGAVALYGPGTAKIDLRMNITSLGLVDVLVYTIRNPTDVTPTLQLLREGQKAFVENATHMSGEETVSRCYGMMTRMTTPYRLTTATPGQENKCPLPTSVVINEINADQPGVDTSDFVELFDGGKGNTRLDGLSLVLFNGRSDTAYKAIDLSGYTTDTDGYFVIGNQTTNAALVQPSDFLQNGPDAVALYLSPASRYGSGAAATANNLVDAIVYGTSANNVDPELIRILVKGDGQVLDRVPKSLSLTDVSVSRCSCCSQRNVSVWGVAKPTPGRSNDACIRTNETVVDTLVHLQNGIRINELKAGQSNDDGNMLFIELYDGGIGNIQLKGLLLILYTADNISYSVFDLGTYSTNRDGYFVIGCNADFTNVTGSWLQRGPNAVALSRGSKEQFTQVSRSGLIDAVVYTKNSEEVTQAVSLIDVLTPGQQAIVVDWGTSSDNKSLVRCYTNEARMLTAFSTSTAASPGKPNICPSPTVVINEVDIDQNGYDKREFIELSTMGRPNFPLSNIVLVLYSATTMRAYRAFKLDQVYSDGNGLFLIGSSNIMPPPDITVNGGGTGFLRNVQGAVALYYKRDLYDFVNGTQVSSEGLMDAIVYGRGALNANIQQLLNTLTPGRSMVVENVTSAGEMSISRCDHKASPGAVSYVLSQPTPKAINNCSLAPRVPPASGPVPAGVPNVRINELNTDSPDANKMVYIELIGNSSTSLDGLTLVAYSGQNANKASYVLDLTGQKVNAKGFFLIGNSNVQGADLSQPDNILRSDGLNALVLYKLNASGFVKDQTQAFSNGSVVDFIVYGNISTSVNSSISLLDIFATGQKQIYENDQNLHHDESISRCSPHSIGDMMAFSVTIPTPGAPNNCDMPTVLINEINADSPGSDDKEFIELWDGGSGNTALNWIVLVLYNGANGQAYYTLDLTNKRTDANGFYIVGGANVANVDHVLSLAGRSVSIIQNGPDAIALYRGHSSNFTTGMSPTKKGLIDAVVYGTNDAQNRVLLDSLLRSGQMQINEDPEFLNGDESISRCSCSTPMDYQCFTLTTPSPKTGNNCTNPTPRPSTTVAVPTGDLPKVVINEVNVDQPGLDITEFIELAGPPGASLAGYSLVLFSYSVPLKRASVSAQFNLNNYRISNTGLFLISNHTRFSVKTDYVLPIPGIIENGIEAIVLYDNRQLTISDAMQPTQQGVMDAIVHCTSVWDRDLGKQLITTLGLKGSAAIVEDATFHRDDESINRCDGNDTMDLNSFKLSLVTPGKPNTCPKIKFARPVQLKLINADCREWRNNVSLLFVFKENVAYSINEQCNCGFSADYIADLKVHCGGSVVLVFSIIGTSEEHIKNVYSSFIEYVNSSKSIKVAGHQYNLESCIDNKCYIQPSGQTGKPGQLGVSVGVGLGCAAALIVVIIVTVICIKKRRSGTLHFQMARFDDTDDDLEDEWVGGAPASFNNPLYSKILS